MERIGPEVAATISQHFASLGRILQWVDSEDLDELTIVDGIGEKVAQIFRTGIQKRRGHIEELSTIIEITDEAPAATGILEGRSFCITGSLTKPRKEIALAIKNAGGRVVSSVSNSLDVLVAGDNAGSKLSKAQNLGLVVWSEEKLFLEISNNLATDISSKTLFDF
jgi:DNA ligase (NAD+)